MKFISLVFLQKNILIGYDSAKNKFITKRYETKCFCSLSHLLSLIKKNIFFTI